MARPLPSEYASFYQTYIEKVEANSIEEIINKYSQAFIEAIESLPETKADFAYAEGKWTVKELLQHIIDSERVFVYRALRIARQDPYNLPGFNENVFAAHSHASARSFNSLKEEFAATRKSTDLFLLSLTEQALQQQGTANNHPISVLAIAFIIFGHIRHHIQILQERYL
jgi:hypothetical protein